MTVGTHGGFAELEQFECCSYFCQHGKPMRVTQLIQKLLYHVAWSGGAIGGAFKANHVH
jgi:hypothetical protein